MAHISPFGWHDLSRSLSAVVAVSGAAIIGLAAASTASADPAPDTSAYLADLQTHGVDIGPGNLLVDAGLSICDALHRGQSFDQALETVEDSNFSPEQSGIIVGSSVRWLCPDLGPAMEAWLQANGS